MTSARRIMKADITTIRQWVTTAYAVVLVGMVISVLIWTIVISEITTRTKSLACPAICEVVMQDGKAGHFAR